MNLNIARVIAETLQNTYDVVLTRSTQQGLALANRVAIAQQRRADLFVSIHCNAAENRNARGTEVFYTVRGCAMELARTIHGNLTKLGLRGRGIKPGTFYVLRHATMPALLVEVGFISNPEEERLLASQQFQEEVALQISSAISRHLT